jgi:hypothetical protein
VARPWRLTASCRLRSVRRARRAEDGVTNPCDSCLFRVWRKSYSSRAQLNLINRAKAGAKIARESVDKEMKALSKVSGRPRSRGRAHAAFARVTDLTLLLQRVKLSESKQVVDGRLVTVLSVD